jgi:hypothetical protein
VTKSSRLADALLRNVRDSDVASVLFRRTTPQVREVTVTAGLSDEVALSHLRGDLDQVLVVARSSRSPTVLGRYARDPRISVRREVAANPHTDLDTVRYLHEWAHAKEDIITLHAVVSRLPVSEALAALRTTKIPEHQYPWVALAQATQKTGTADAYRQLVAAGHERVYHYVVAHLFDDGVPGYPIDEFLSSVPEPTALALLADGLRELSYLSVATTRLAIRYAADLEVYQSTTCWIPNVKVVDPVAVPLIVHSDVESLWSALARTPVKPSVIHQLLDKDHFLTTWELVTAEHRPLTSAMAEKAAMTLAREASASNVERFLRRTQVRLSTDAVLAVLRVGNLNLTRAWLYGELPVTPRPGEVAALIAAPGNAFRPDSRSRFANQTNGLEDPPLDTIAGRLGPLLFGVPDPLRFEELVDALGPHMLDVAERNTAMAAWLADKASAAFGSDTALWEVFLGYADAWSGTVNDLIQVTFLTLDRQPPPPAPIPIATPSGRTRSVDQLPLFE